MKRFGILIWIVLTLAYTHGLAQGPSPALMFGHPAFTPEDGDKVESVNLSTGSLHIEIPIYSTIYRAKTYTWKYVYDSTPFEAVYNSSIDPAYASSGTVFWNVLPNYGGGSGGWRFVSPFDWSLNYDTIATDSSGVGLQCQFSFNGGFFGFSYQILQNFSVVEPDGTQHPLLNKVYIPVLPGQPYNPCADAFGDEVLDSVATDGSGISYNAQTNKITLKDGTILPNGPNNGFAPAQPYEDTNGNFVPSAPFVSGPITNNGQGLISIHDAMGNPQSVTVQNVSVPIFTNDCSWLTTLSVLNPVAVPASQCMDNSPSGQITIPQPHQIVLPNGQTYTFNYNMVGHGEIISMTLPTGAQVEYTYRPDTEMYSNSMSVYAGTTVYYHQIVNTRKVTTDGVASIWKYNILAPYTTNPNFSFTAPTVQDPNGNCIDYWLGGPGLVAVPTDTFYYDGCDRSKVLRHVKTDYLWDEFDTASGPSYINIRPVKVTTNLENGLSNQVQTDYEMMQVPYLSGQISETRMNPTEVREYDFGSSTPSRVTDYTYLHNMGSGVATASQYTALGIVDRPTSKVVKDGTGNVVAQTQYEYDNYTQSIQSESTASAHDDTNFSSTNRVRGNMTAMSAWNNQTGGWLTTRYNYDDLGNKVSLTDPRGNPTYVSYVDSFTDSSCMPSSGAMYSVPTQITNALGQQIRAKYSSCAAVPTQIQDANDIAQGRTGTTYSYDAVNNLINISHPDGGNTAYNFHGYINPLTITTSMALSNMQSVNTTLQLDGRGRPSITTAADGSTSTTTYDLVGNVASVSNLHSAQSSPSDGVTTYTYDPLGRIIFQQQPDSSQLQWCYDGTPSNNSQTVCSTNASSVPNASWVDSSDEAGRHWQQVSDGFGRLVAAMETDPFTNMLDLETDYKYDPLNNLLMVNQVGNKSTETSRTRSFQYDSLSRLLMATNPETGLVCYGQYSGGICANGYDASGNLLYKTDARGNTTAYTYDALNRLTQKTHWDGTPGSYFTYDSWTAWGQAPTNAIGRLAYETNNVNANNIFSYDAMGRTTRVEGCVPDECGIVSHVTTAHYDLAGHMNRLTYPDGRQITEYWDCAGRLVSVNAGAPPLPSDCSAGASTPPYWTANSYFPDGSLKSVTYGSGANELRSENSRSQTCELSMFMPPTIGGTQLFDRQYFFGQGGGGPACAPAVGNNGNISQIVDNTNPMAGSNARNQTFGYDTLNRLKTWSTPSMAGSPRGQNYSYDSFGNLSQTNGVGMPNFSPGYDANNRMQNLSCGSTIYDAAGNVLCQGIWGVDAQSYLYDAESRVSQVQAQSMGTQFNVVAQYAYDAEGNRIRKDVAPFNNQNYTEYVYFGGQPIAEKDQHGNWTDYIYADGQKIAKVAPSDTRIHTHGVFTASGNELRWNLPVPQNAGGGWYTVKSGDMLCFRQYNAGGVGGPLIGYNNGQWTAWQWSDTNGVILNQDGLQNTWHSRCMDLTMGGATTGSNLQQVWLLTDISTGPGTWDIWYADMAITSADGTVTQIIGAQPPVPVYGDFQGGAWTGTPTAYVETVPAGQDTTAALASGATTHYYVGDQIGSTSYEMASGGWPLWQGNYAPFGQQVLPGTATDFVGPLPADGTDMHYKFTGKERDTESGLDYFGVRYYASSMGRFMSPDPMGGHIEDPQTLNRYSYVANNPLSRTDPSGMDFYLACTAAKDGSNASTCQGGHVGTTTDGKFSATVITSDSLRDPNSGNSAVVTQNGVQITTGGQTYTGQYFENPASDAQHSGDGTDHNPIDLAGSSLMTNFTFHVDGNCGGHCYASGETSFRGTPEDAQKALTAMGSQQTWFDKMSYEGHSADEWFFHWNSTTNRMALDSPITLVLQVPKVDGVLAVPHTTEMEWRVVNTGWQHIKDAWGALNDPHTPQ